jgi:hypothetical protein
MRSRPRTALRNVWRTVALSERQVERLGSPTPVGVGLAASGRSLADLAGPGGTGEPIDQVGARSIPAEMPTELIHASFERDIE